MQKCSDGILRPSKSRRTYREVVEDFWARVDRRSEDECWEWTGGRNGKTKLQSYGVFWALGKRSKAHRFAFEISKRKLKNGECVCHRCDNPPCCNPAHLFAGTHGDNIRDALSKGRIKHERGEDRYNATLTEADIRTIRAVYQKRSTKGMNGAKLARKYGVVKSMIHAIVTRRRWKHVI